MSFHKIGIDIGSTTIKTVLLDGQDHPLYTDYTRHNARVRESLATIFGQLHDRFGNLHCSLTVSGSVGLGIAERCGIRFVQEVVALTGYVRRHIPQAATLIDIGGEDAKVVYLGGTTPDMHMNGNCAGGTGAFIDRMALLLNTTPEGLDRLAACASRHHPIASRCGVFAKTDVQNLAARNVPREEIAASIFHAVAVQTIVTLSHGCDMTPPVLFCGGPLTLLPALRRAFSDYLHLTGADTILPDDGRLLTAHGAALTADDSDLRPLADWQRCVCRCDSAPIQPSLSLLAPIFDSAADYTDWQLRKQSAAGLKSAPIPAGRISLTLGIDSGSTTTKIVALDPQGRLLFSYYAPNDGNPVATVERGLHELDDVCRKAGAHPFVRGGCSTGYGEELVKAAFRLDHAIIETIAHYRAAREVVPDVSFILDIGGQDMKAIFVERGIVTRMELNEACSSGCGSFIETFARSLGLTADRFASLAATARHPCDLGTRCTVFMNSKVKQVLREGASIDDIAAGLSYSVVRNCLYKVLKLRSADDLGPRVVVQGGTMRNDAIVRAFERLTGRDLYRSDHPELMGAYGCALHAMEHPAAEEVPLERVLQSARYTPSQLMCRGCENRCSVTRYRFSGGSDYFSGNRCERHFTNGGEAARSGENAFAEKLRLLFDRPERHDARLTIGIPRVLNLYEEYPFWHTLLYNCGIRTVLSAPSEMARYERSVRRVMSDSICFPAKLVHSHIDNLVAQGVDRILMPYVVFEAMEGEEDLNSYNCPIVTGYSDVVRSVERLSIPLDTPTITFKEEKSLFRQCADYLGRLGIPIRQIRTAFRRALDEQRHFAETMQRTNAAILQRSREAGRMALLLAGRPYHADPLIQHRLAETIAAMGVDLLTDDIARIDPQDKTTTSDKVHFVAQWAFANRILHAAQWAARQDESVQFVETTSFGCGPDALLTDAIRDLLGRHGKSLTLLKIDDVTNTGSLKLRVRSLVESLRLGERRQHVAPPQPFVTPPPFTRRDRQRKILLPFFTPFISPLLPALMHRAGYDAESLPPSSPASAETGLRHANNEICYPATLIVGDLIAALRSGRYDPSQTAVAITQTGGQCRASSYIALIRRALVEAGFSSVPVISVSPGSGLTPDQPGFEIPWRRLFRAAVGSVLFSDTLARLYHAAAVRTDHPDKAASMRDDYLQCARRIIASWPESRQIAALIRLTERAAADFARIATRTVNPPQVGIVGEIYLKFNPFAQKGVTEWLVSQGIEVVPPVLTGFFMQGFVNSEVRCDSHLEHPHLPRWLLRAGARRIQRMIDGFNRAAAHFAPFRPLGNIYNEARAAAEILSLNAQFGEGWLLPGEVASYARQGINHVVSLQPFGCIANQIVAKGVERRIRERYPQLNLLTLDFDSSVSDVNITNRLLLFIDTLRHASPHR